MKAPNNLTEDTRRMLEAQARKMIEGKAKYQALEILWQSKLPAAAIMPMVCYVNGRATTVKYMKSVYGERAACTQPKPTRRK